MFIIYKFFYFDPHDLFSTYSTSVQKTHCIGCLITWL